MFSTVCRDGNGLAQTLMYAYYHTIGHEKLRTGDSVLTGTERPVSCHLNLGFLAQTKVVEERSAI